MCPYQTTGIAHVKPQPQVDWANFHRDVSLVPPLHEVSTITDVGSHIVFNDSYLSLSGLLNCKLRYLLLDCILNFFKGSDICHVSIVHVVLLDAIQSHWMLIFDDFILNFILLKLVYVLSSHYGPYNVPPSPSSPILANASVH